MLETVLEIEKYLGLQEGFFHNLQLEDDWSLIIKLNSLIETSCSAMLAESLCKPELKEVFSQLQTGNPKNGKLGFISKLRLLTSEEIKFIEALASLRNCFVHNIGSTQINITDHLAGLKKDHKKAFEHHLNLSESITFNGVKYSKDEVVASFPRQAIWISGMACLHSICVQIIFGQKRRALLEAHIAELKKNGPIMLTENDFKIEPFPN
jgi:hypothetical protein